MLKIKRGLVLFISLPLLLTGCTLSYEGQLPSPQAQATFQIIATSANKDIDLREDIKPIVDYRARISKLKNFKSEIVDNKLVVTADMTEFTPDIAQKLTEPNQLSIGEQRTAFTNEEITRKKTYNEEQKKIMDRAYAEAKDLNNFDLVVTTYSENPNIVNKSIHNYRKNEGLQKDIADTLFSTGTGSLTDLVSTPNMVWFAKVLDRQELEEVTAQHILISYIGSKAKNPYLYRTKTQAEKYVNEIKDSLTPENFSEKAKEISDDSTNNSKGGSLGAFPRGSMTKPFEDAAFSADINKVIGPVETEFGWHFILVTKKETVPLVKYQDIVRFLKPLAPPLGYVPVLHIGNQIKDIQAQVKTEKDATTSEEKKNYRIIITFANEGKLMLLDFAKSHAALENLAFMIDDDPYWKLASSDQIMSDGSIVLQGELTEEQVRGFDKQMKFYSLPTPIQLTDYQILNKQ